MKHTIALLLCGGTIDKTYFPDREVFDFTDTHIQEMAKQARMPDIHLNIRQLMLKDSLDMNDSDRTLVAEECANTPEDRIMITHGTSTMTKTAQRIDEYLSKKNRKVIVLFGAMIPYELKNSDALFNFGLATAACQTFPPGVYIAMSGNALEYHRFVKNEHRAVFESKD